MGPKALRGRPRRALRRGQTTSARCSKNPTGVLIELARRPEISHKGREKRLRCRAPEHTVGCKFACPVQNPLASHTLRTSQHVPGMRHIPEMSEDI